jgi:hypothetical protein
MLTTLKFRPILPPTFSAASVMDVPAIHVVFGGVCWSGPRPHLGHLIEPSGFSIIRARPHTQRGVFVLPPSL